MIKLSINYEVVIEHGGFNMHTKNVICCRVDCVQALFLKKDDKGSLFFFRKSSLSKV